MERPWWAADGYLRAASIAPDNENLLFRLAAKEIFHCGDSFRGKDFLTALENHSSRDSLRVWKALMESFLANSLSALLSFREQFADSFADPTVAGEWNSLVSRCFV